MFKVKATCILQHMTNFVVFEIHVVNLVCDLFCAIVHIFFRPIYISAPPAQPASSMPGFLSA